MNKEFIPYDLALALKELGFDEPCFVYWVYDGVEVTYSTSHNKSGWSMIGFKNSQMLKKAGLCTAPTFSQAFKCFREKHNLPSYIHTMWQHDWNNYSYQWHITEENEEWNGIKHYKTYEKAELSCLKKLIEIVKNL